MTRGSSLVAWWLGLWASIAVARVQSLVWELRSCKSSGMAKKTNKQKNKKTRQKKKEDRTQRDTQREGHVTTEAEMSDVSTS